MFWQSLYTISGVSFGLESVEGGKSLSCCQCHTSATRNHHSRHDAVLFQLRARFITNQCKDEAWKEA